MSTLQKNQHYVWRYYLLAWARGNQVWCTRAPSTRAFSPNVANIGSETFFYQITELNEADLAYLEQLVGQATDPRLQDLNRGWLDAFQKSFALRRAFAGHAIPPNAAAELAEGLDEIEKTLAERYHGGLEQRALPILDRLRLGDAAFYDDLKDALTFIEFLAHQYFRTAKMRNAIGRLPIAGPHNPERTWPIESYIYATNVGASFVARRRDYRITFLENATPVPFVAGDQPVINLKRETDDELSFYYPLSPTLAMVYHADPERFPTQRMTVSGFEVEHYNAKLYSRSDSQMYGSDRAYLEGLVSLPKDELAF